MKKTGINFILLIVLFQLCLASSSALAGYNGSEETISSGLPDSPSSSAPISPLIKIHLDETSIEHYSVAYNSNRKEFMVIWHELNEADFGRSIYGRRVSVYGDTIGTAFQIMSLTDIRFRQSDIVYVPKHDTYWIGVFEDKSFNNAIWVKSITWKGETITQELIKDNTDSPGGPTLAMAYNTKNDQVMIVYENKLSNTNLVIGAICLKAGDGEKCGEKDVAASTKRLRYPDIAFNPARTEYLIGYTMFGGAGDGNIKGKICNADLSTCSSEKPITVHGSPWQDSLSLASGPDEYLAVWWERYSTDSEGNWGRRIGGDGTLNNFINIIPGSGRFGGPIAVYGDTGRYLITSFNSTHFVGRFLPPGKDTPVGDTFIIEKTGEYPSAVAAACQKGVPCLVVYTVYIEGKGVEVRGRLVGYWNRNHLPVVYR